MVLWDGARDRFTLGATTVAGQDDSAPARRLRTRAGATAWVVENGHPHVVEDIATDPLAGNDIAGEYGVQAYAAVPIQLDGAVLGVLFALDTEPRTYTADDLDFLGRLARRAATAIANARLLADSRAARERSEALAWVANALIAAEGLHEVLQSVVAGVAAALVSERVELVTIDRDPGTYVDRFAGGMEGVTSDTISFAEYDSGITGWVLAEERLALSGSLPDDERAEPGARDRWRDEGIGPAVIAPLRYGTHLLGTLSVLRNSDQPGFSEDEVDLVIAMSSQAAVAIENVRLMEATRSTLREAEALFSVSQALTTAEGLDDVVGVVAEGVADVLPAEQVDVQLAEGTAATDAPGASAAVLNVLDEGALDVLRSGNPLRGSDVATRVDIPGPVLIAPLKAHDRLLGAVVASNPAGAPDFRPRQVELLMTLSAHAAAALDGARLLEEVQRLAVTDDLTGAHNRRHLFELAEMEFRQATRYLRPLAAIMFDIDRFKDINDRYGHAIGDLVLRWVADHCRAVVRKADVWGRYGGEEFAVLLPETGLKGAVEMAERLRSRVAAGPIETPRGPVPVTISLGVAELQESMRDVHALIDRADAAMYFAKRTGRNRVEAA